ncbi:CDP-glucose 4,6-dehydratase [bacterium]|nr:CDP-glucose 4,6-dehydratase [bacterium]
MKRGTFETYFRGKRVFVTGHTGFKGAWLLVWLHQLGAIVKGFALSPDTNPSLYTQINGDTLCESVIADIADSERLNREIAEFKPDVIFHLAAQPLVRRSYSEPKLTWQTNVMGTINVLESLRALKNPCVAVLITTDKVYENIERDIQYRETDPLGGHDPYSASKSAADIAIQSYIRSFFGHTSSGCVHIASARAGNVVGGGDWAEDRLIPDLVRAFSAGVPLEIRFPGSVRPWQHVLEPLSGYLQLARSLSLDPERFSGAWNFGPNSDGHLTVAEIVGMSQSVWGGGVVNVRKSTQNPHEAGLLKLDISKAESSLGWVPKFDAKTSIEMTLNWYKAHQQGRDALELCRKDLARYGNGKLGSQ